MIEYSHLRDQEVWDLTLIDLVVRQMDRKAMAVLEAVVSATLIATVVLPN